MWRTLMKNKWCFLLLLPVLSACQFSEETIAENEKVIAEWKARSSGRVEPLPEFKKDKTVNHSVIFKLDNFVTAANPSTSFKTCRPVAKGDYQSLLKDVDIGDIHFIQTKVMQDNSTVTVWSNGSISQLASGSMISRQSWLIEQVEKDSVVLAQLDLKCGYINKKQKLILSNNYQ